MKKQNFSLILITSLIFSLAAVANDVPAKKAKSKSTAVSAESQAKKPETAPKTVESAPMAPAAAVVYEGVTLSPTSKLATAQPAELKEVSYGIRRKKVFAIAVVDVYVAEFYALNPEKIQKTDDEVLNSLPAAGPVQIKLTLKRDLSGSDITKSFKEALKENDVDLSQTVPGLTELMTEIDSLKSVKKGEVFALTADWRDNQFNIHVIKPDQSVKTIAANEMALKKLFSIWLGKPVDDKMNDLKKNLLK